MGIKWFFFTQLYLNVQVWIRLELYIYIYVYNIFLLLSFDSVVANFACLQSHFQPMLKKNIYRLSAVNTYSYTPSGYWHFVYPLGSLHFLNHPFCHPWHLSYSFLLFDYVPATMSFKQIWKNPNRNNAWPFEYTSTIMIIYYCVRAFRHCLHHGGMVFGSQLLGTCFISSLVS